MIDIYENLLPIRAKLNYQEINLSHPKSHLARVARIIAPKAPF